MQDLKAWVHTVGVETLLKVCLCQAFSDIYPAETPVGNVNKAEMAPKFKTTTAKHQCSKQLEEAYQYYFTDPEKLTAGVSREFGVPRSTLQGRIHGARPHKEAHRDQQHLSSKEEEEIVCWITKWDDQGFPMKRSCVETMARELLIAKEGPGAKPLGNKWV